MTAKSSQLRHNGVYETLHTVFAKVEAALYAGSGGEANVHFTVSHDHLALFRRRVDEKLAYYEKMFGVAR